MLRVLLANLLLLTSLGLNAKEVLTVFTADNGAPKHYLDSDGQVKGYAVDIAREAIERVGLTPRLVARPWKRAQQEAMLGKGVITGFSRTPSREAYYLFTEPLFSDRVLLIYNSRNPITFNAYNDLAGLRIGISRGSNYSGEFNQMRPLLIMDEDSSHIQRLRKLLAGRLDGAIFSGDMFTILFNADMAGLNVDNLIPAAKPISIDPNHLGIPNNLRGFDPEHLKRQLDQAIQAMHQDGTIQKFRQHYSQALNQKLDYRTAPPLNE
ncbi:MAG: transporter substrate-binding domain-containing protein [Candidatus Pelagadaptatus aseana]|uniref:substrate-binding periplasmic protein n=1 Tax=Candidatus Pelagadaptatus aseana TaxID=3120508 RepID=UPI0039B26BCB